LKIILHDFTLQLKNTFKIARDSYDTRQHVIVELQHNGFSGFGEAITHSYYNVTVSDIHQAIEKVRQKITSYDLKSPEDFWASLAPDLQHNPFVQCAIDNAAHDLFGKISGLPTYKIWGLNLSNLPISNYTIGIDSIEVMLQKMQDFPWCLYKIKLGTTEDLAIIETLRKHTDVPFRVDANCGWSAEETIYNAKYLKPLNVQFIEQPLKAGDWEGMKEVFKKSVLPIIADESCIAEEDVARCHQHFHGINIKLVKCGGLTPARRMINEARRLQMQVMCGCMTETSIGMSAIGHLLPMLDYVDMDGALLLKNDPAQGVFLKDNQVFFPDENGLGCQLKSLK
jgi:L-Ala-D/L-Glu epimerase